MMTCRVELQESKGISILILYFDKLHCTHLNISSEIGHTGIEPGKAQILCFEDLQNGQRVKVRLVDRVVVNPCKFNPATSFIRLYARSKSQHILNFFNRCSLDDVKEIFSSYSVLRP